jgi:hypothetical protein
MPMSKTKSKKPREYTQALSGHLGKATSPA